MGDKHDEVVALIRTTLSPFVRRPLINCRCVPDSPEVEQAKADALARHLRTKRILETCRRNDGRKQAIAYRGFDFAPVICFHPPGSFVKVKSRENDPIPNRYRVQKLEISRGGFTRYFIAGRWEQGLDVFPLEGEPIPIASMPFL